MNFKLKTCNSLLLTYYTKLQNINSLNVACYVSTEYLLADFQIINKKSYPNLATLDSLL